MGQAVVGVRIVVVVAVLLQRKVDEQRLADDGGARNEAPIAAVLAVVAVVAEDEVAVRRDGELAVVDQRLHLNPPVGGDVGVGVLQSGKVVAEVVGRAGAVDGVRLVKGVTVDEDAARVKAKAVAGQADDALDEMERGVDGIVEDDDIAPVNGGGRQKASGAI